MARGRHSLLVFLFCLVSVETQAAPITVLTASGPGALTLGTVLLSDPTPEEQSFWFGNGSNAGHPGVLSGTMDVYLDLIASPFIDLALNVQTSSLYTLLLNLHVMNLSGADWSFMGAQTQSYMQVLAGYGLAGTFMPNSVFEAWKTTDPSSPPPIGLLSAGAVANGMTTVSSDFYGNAINGSGFTWSQGVVSNGSSTALPFVVDFLPGTYTPTIRLDVRSETAPIEPTPVPEPATSLLVTTGLFVAAFSFRRRMRVNNIRD